MAVPGNLRGEEPEDDGAEEDEERNQVERVLRGSGAGPLLLRQVAGRIAGRQRERGRRRRRRAAPRDSRCTAGPVHLR